MTAITARRSVLITATLLALLVPLAVKSQDDDSKAIKAEVFLNKRPTKATRSSARYKPVAKAKTANPTTPPDGTVAAEMGLTIWRYRQAKSVDKKELVEEDEGQEWILERITEDTLLVPGQKIRLSFESLSRKGYLYVIDREEYADGTFGDPRLMFPTQRSIDRNQVEPGRPIYIPSATGKFRIKPSAGEKVHVAESLTVIVSAKPLIDEGELRNDAIKLQPVQFNEWLKRWQTVPTKFEMDGGAGMALTSVEHSAANLDSPLLSQGDPGPQTIYQLLAKPDDPLLIILPLRFAR